MIRLRSNILKESKLKTYIGFAIKSNNIVFGYDKLFENKKTPKLVIVCSSLNEKNTNKIIDFCSSQNIQYYKLNEILLSDLTSRNNCKCIGVCDDNLSNVICNELELLNGKQ